MAIPKKKGFHLTPTQGKIASKRLVLAGCASDSSDWRVESSKDTDVALQQNHVPLESVEEERRGEERQLIMFGYPGSIRL